MFLKKRLLPITPLLVFLLSIAGCAQQPAQQEQPQQAEPPAVETKDVILATTTSTQDSGLLDVLIPEFEKQTGYVVKTIAVGTGGSIGHGPEGRSRCFADPCPFAGNTDG